jgi:hypothetical protein
MAYIVGPCVFDLQQTPATIVPNAPDPEIMNGCSSDAQRLDAVDTISNPLPTTSAPVKVRDQMARHRGVGVGAAVWFIYDASIPKVVFNCRRITR